MVENKAPEDTRLTFWDTFKRHSAKLALVIAATGAADWLPAIFTSVTSQSENLQAALGDSWYGVLVTVLGIACFVARMLPQKGLGPE